jgi:predicted nuclease with TOPRIM domain
VKKGKREGEALVLFAVAFFLTALCMWQKVMKEKNALAERLKNAEAARKRFDDELKRYATENVTREEIRQSLEDEIRRLTQTVGETEGEKREKEEQVARCEAYIDGMESKLQACQVFALK